MTDDQTSYALARAEERSDVLAMLERHQRGCLAMEKKHPQETERARVMSGMLSLLIDEVGKGMHEGEAAIDAARRGDA